MKPDPPTLEPDPRFPSGSWEGNFLQRQTDGTKRLMELDLAFQTGRVSGHGRDGIGPFTLTGGYDTDAGKARWTKRCPTHDVFYQGYAESKGIWGVWEMGQLDRDGFHIWPKGTGQGDARSERREASPPLTFETLDLEPVVAEA